MPRSVSINPDQKLQLLALADSTIDTLIHRANVDHNIVIKKPTVCLSQRGKIAGSAVLQRNHIRLNAILFWQNKTTFLEDVIPHELAHLMVYQRYSHGFKNQIKSRLGKSNTIKPHGIEWQTIMQEVFMRPAKATHSLDVKDVMQASFEYQCKCEQTVYLSLIRHNKVLRNKQLYRCRKCNEVLTPKTCA